jgi:hypothetical protein
MIKTGMHRNRRRALALAVVLTAGCASSEPARPAPTTPGSTPAAVEPGAGHGAAPIDGLWVEFWALQGHADTQRYALFPDGRFGWCAASDGPARGGRRWGRWTAQGDTLVLRVQGADSGKDCQAAGCLVQHEPPLEERLQLGPCPPNEEAKALDASYRCLSIAGQAFWRRTQADDPAAYFPE